jgi:hypothetical protein
MEKRVESYSFIVYGRDGCGGLESCSSLGEEVRREAELIIMGWEIIGICGTLEAAQRTLRVYEES